MRLAPDPAIGAGMATSSVSVTWLTALCEATTLQLTFYAAGVSMLDTVNITSPLTLCKASFRGSISLGDRGAPVAKPAFQIEAEEISIEMEGDRCPSGDIEHPYMGVAVPNYSEAPQQRQVELLFLESSCIGETKNAMESIVLKKVVSPTRQTAVVPISDPDCRSIVRAVRTHESGMIEIEARIAEAKVHFAPGIFATEYPRVDVTIQLMPSVAADGMVHWSRKGEPRKAFPGGYLSE